MKYVVQKISDAAGGGWMDIATVEGHPRERRSTIIKRAFKDDPPRGQMAVRVLDEASAHVWPVESEVQTKLRIG